MRALPLRLLAVAVSLVGLVALADLEQRALRREADRIVATAVAGYLTLVVPPDRDGRYAADRLVSTVSRLEGSAYWHAGLQVTLAGAPVLDEVAVPRRVVPVPLPGPTLGDTVGTVAVWDSVTEGRLPDASWVIAAATFLVAGLATTRRAGWLWPLLGLGLLLLLVRALLAGTGRTADRVAEGALDHLGPMAALVLLDARAEPAQLQRLGEAIEIREVGTDGTPEPPGWRERDGRRVRMVQVARGGGAVVELDLAPPGVGSQALELGLAGGALVLFLAMLPPIVPRRRPPRLPGGAEGATIRE